jgi:hypothetical protein
LIVAKTEARSLSRVRGRTPKVERPPRAALFERVDLPRTRERLSEPVADLFNLMPFRFGGTSHRQM